MENDNTLDTIWAKVKQQKAKSSDFDLAFVLLKETLPENVARDIVNTMMNENDPLTCFD